MPEACSSRTTRPARYGHCTSDEAAPVVSSLAAGIAARNVARDSQGASFGHQHDELAAVTRGTEALKLSCRGERFRIEGEKDDHDVCTIAAHRPTESHADT